MTINAASTAARRVIDPQPMIARTSREAMGAVLSIIHTPTAAVVPAVAFEALGHSIAEAITLGADHISPGARATLYGAAASALALAKAPAPTDAAATLQAFAGAAMTGALELFPEARTNQELVTAGTFDDARLAQLYLDAASNRATRRATAR